MLLILNLLPLWAKESVISINVFELTFKLLDILVLPRYPRDAACVSEVPMPSQKARSEPR